METTQLVLSQFKTFQLRKLGIGEVVILIAAVQF